jgi:hypothetical protein
MQSTNARECGNLASFAQITGQLADRTRPGKHQKNPIETPIPCQGEGFTKPPPFSN